MLQQKLQNFNYWHILPYVYFYAIRSLKGPAVALRAKARI